MIGKARKRRGGRVPGVSVPSTAKSRAASRVNGWRSGRYARAVSAGEVFEAATIGDPVREARHRC